MIVNIIGYYSLVMAVICFLQVALSQPEGTSDHFKLRLGITWITHGLLLIVCVLALK